MRSNMRVYLVYYKFFDESLKEPTIGGIQTYISDLSELLLNNSHSVVIIQQSDNDNSFSWNGRLIQNIKSDYSRINEYKKLLKLFFKKNLRKDDLIIFMTHTLSFSLNFNRTITIQHGIYWDIPNDKPKSNALVEFIFRNLHSWKDIKSINQSNCCVAVDYNFLNWYKTQQYYLRSNIQVIPNYCIINESPREGLNSEIIKILFARRFETYRGTRVFTGAISKILDEYANIMVTYAGSGTDEGYLKKYFEKEKRVEFIKFNHKDTMKIHSMYDIAVVPSIGSEGTSLSLLEAMGSGCAVISTNVGGLTNIIISGYNGIIVNIDSESIANGLRKLINNPSLRSKIAKNGYETVKYGFNKEIWEKEWYSIIKRYEVS